MKVTEISHFQLYSEDDRFEAKKPYRSGSRKQSCGDNIYYRSADDTHWLQRDSFHSKSDGSIKADHVERDTGVDRILISDDFYYFGGEGPEVPEEFRNADNYDVCRKVRSRKRCHDNQWIALFEAWLRSFGDPGFYGRPLDWILEDG